MTSVVIVGGGPGGYEAALVARQLGADVTLVDRDGPGGSAVLTDAVPSKTLVATANAITATASSANLGVLIDGRSPEPSRIGVDLRAVNERIAGLVRAQSDDIRARLLREGITLDARRRAGSTRTRTWSSPAATARRRPCWRTPCSWPPVPARGCCPDALPDGERILTWEQLYDLDDRAGAPDRGRLRRDRSRVRRRLPRPRQPGRAHLLPRSGAAGRGSGCRAGAGGGLRPPWPRGARLVAGGCRPSHR